MDLIVVTQELKIFLNGLRTPSVARANRYTIGQLSLPELVLQGVGGWRRMHMDQSVWPWVHILTTDQCR